MLHGANFFERASPVEDKFYALTRMVDSVRADQLKPNRLEQEAINQTVFKPLFLNLTEKEKDLFWKYRHYCSAKSGELLPRFLLAVNWQNPRETDIAAELMKNWVPIDVNQALSLLSGFFSLNNVYTHMRIANPVTKHIIEKFKEIRAKAVNCLRTVKHETLSLIITTLVQALRYEEYIETESPIQSGLKEFLIDMSLKDQKIYNSVYWALQLEVENRDKNPEELITYFADVVEDLLATSEAKARDFYEGLQSAIMLRTKLLDFSSFLKRKKMNSADTTRLLRAEINGNRD
jgi:hypothetical protein